MAQRPRILAFAGSTRTGSFNKMLVRIAAKGAQELGAEVAIIDLRELALPLYDQDLEAADGLPDGARRLKAEMVAADGFLIASPEHNSSISAALKNAIDWVSRPVAGEPALVAFKGKVASILSASPGGLGGLRGLVHLRSILGNIGVIVLPDQIAVPKAHEAFLENGVFADETVQASVQDIGRGLVRFLTKLKGSG